jgi:hypothetical protein
MKKLFTFSLLIYSFQSLFASDICRCPQLFPQEEALQAYIKKQITQNAENILDIQYLGDIIRMSDLGHELFSSEDLENTDTNLPICQNEQIHHFCPTRKRSRFNIFYKNNSYRKCHRIVEIITTPTFWNHKNLSKEQCD